MMTVLILSVVLTVTLSAADIVRNGLMMSNAQVNSTKAYFAAEAGAERILWEIRKNSFDPGDGTGADPECQASPADICFDAFPGGSINECVAPTNCSNFDNQELGNQATYKLNFSYEEISPDATTTLSSLGFFGDTHRNVQLKYGH